jgi:hypothetical protein
VIVIVIANVFVIEIQIVTVIEIQIVTVIVILNVIVIVNVTVIVILNVMVIVIMFTWKQRSYSMICPPTQHKCSTNNRFVLVSSACKCHDRVVRPDVLPDMRTQNDCRQLRWGHVLQW